VRGIEPNFQVIPNTCHTFNTLLVLALGIHEHLLELPDLCSKEEEYSRLGAREATIERADLYN
jgi:hypothetical protein